MSTPRETMLIIPERLVHEEVLKVIGPFGLALYVLFATGYDFFDLTPLLGYDQEWEDALNRLICCHMVCTYGDTEDVELLPSKRWRITHEGA